MNPKSILVVLNNMLYDGFGSGVFNSVTTHQLKETGVISLSPENKIGMIDFESMTIYDYIEIVREQRYSAMFSDYSLIGMELEFLGNEFIRHRYMYIPCPLSKKLIDSIPEEYPFVDFIEQLEKSSLPDKIISQGFLRFDFTNDDPKDKELFHPRSHMTIVAGECRVPLVSPLSIGHFLTFIFTNFQTKDVDFLEKHINQMKVEYGVTILEVERQRMYMGWHSNQR